MIKLDGKSKEAWKNLSQEKRGKFLDHLVQIISFKELFHNFNKNQLVFTIIDTIYFNKGEIISKKTFYNSIKRIHGCLIYCLVELNKFFRGDLNWDPISFIP